MTPPSLVDDDESLERVLLRFEALGRRLTRQRGLAGDDVEEVLQDVRIRIWSARRSSENPVALSASYFMKAVSSAVIDHVRRRQRQRTVPLPAETSHDDVPQALQVPPIVSDERDDLARRLSMALASLPRNRRIAVQFHLEGFSRDHIVQSTGWSDAKVRNLLYRGLDDLRDALRKGDGHGAG